MSKTTREHFNEAQPADAPPPQRTNKCPAYGCPNAASTSFDGGSRWSCFAHASAMPADWPKVTADIRAKWPASRNWQAPEPSAAVGPIDKADVLRRLDAIARRLVDRSPAQQCIESIERIVAERGGKISDAQRDMVLGCLKMPGTKTTLADLTRARVFPGDVAEYAA